MLDTGFKPTEGVLAELSQVILAFYPASRIAFGFYPASVFLI
jgi:hypothetical protein